MGSNGKIYDANLEYAKKSINELFALRNKFINAVEKYPQLTIFNEHLEFIKMKIAERIGRKNEY